MQLSSLSLVFPCYNEVENVPRLIDEALRALDRFAVSGEVLIVDDGSSDGTAEAAVTAGRGDPRVKIIRKEHGGYGSTVGKGLMSASCDYVFFSDGDLQFSLSEIELLLPQTASHDIVIGFRRKRADGAHRTVLQRCYRIWSQLLLGVPGSIFDLNCAFKLFRREVLQATFPLVSTGALINAELMTKATLVGARIAQVPVSHFPRERGQQTGGNWRVVGKAAAETWRLASELRRFRKQRDS